MMRLLRQKTSLLLLALVLPSAVLLVACGRPPGPVGWAGPQAVKIDAAQVILVPHRANLYALPQDSSNVIWQFPPKDKNAYAISTSARDSLNSSVDALDIATDQKTNLHNKVRDLHVSGPSIDALKKDVDASDASSDAKGKLKSAVDTATKREKDGLSQVQALYGDLGISSDGKTVFVATFKGWLFALDTHDGHAVWTRDVGDGMVGGVAVSGDTIYYGSKGNRVFAADAATGDVKWTHDTKGEVWSTPTIDGSTVYATSLDGSVYAFDTSGKQKWSFSGVKSGIGSKVAVADGAVYVGAFDNKLYSINAADGTMNWSYGAGNWFWATPVVQSGVVYAASLDSKVYAIDAASGVAKWDKPFNAKAPIRSAPIITGGGLVVANRNGEVYKLDLGSGQPDGDPVLAGTQIYANLTADSSSMVYVSPTAGALFVIDARSQLGPPSTYPLP